MTKELSLEEVHSLKTTAQHLEHQIVNLKIQDYDNREAYLKRKGELTQRKNLFQTKANKLRIELDQEIEKQASKKTDELFISNSDKFYVEVNRRRIKIIDTDLMLPLEFRPCGHKLDIHVKEILRFQKVYSSDSVLLQKWNSILTSGSTTHVLEASFNCSECRRKIENRFRKLRLRKASDTIGICKVILNKF